MSTHVRNIDALSTQTRQYALRVLGSVGEPINPGPGSGTAHMSAVASVRSWTPGATTPPQAPHY